MMDRGCNEPGDEHAQRHPHFSIHADNCQRAKAFYEQVFGWTFEPWGPPNFWRIHTGPGAIQGYDRSDERDRPA